MLKAGKKKWGRWLSVCAVMGSLFLITACHSNPEVKVKLYSDQDPAYQNPFTLPDEWADYGIGDPFILRYDGRYYLYCSTKDGRPGVKGWSSGDLVHWHYEGLVTDDPVTTGAYAPEVVYWNGYFYMYTSPAGKGHYVLRSGSPTGPFEVKTGNLGLSIDGSVFIDDDGKWYFTHAGDKGIVINPMTDPYTIDSGKVLQGAYLGGWTEGSTIIKRNGTYYLTYTGNHVFSKGYRVNYSVAHGSPMSDYRIPDNNPILIHTTDGFFGLGHSSTFIGLDLDSYYMVYHNLVGRSEEGPPVRQMDIDRLVFSGDRMDVLGPTNTPQPVPKSADFHSRPGEPSAAQDWEQEKQADGQIVILSKKHTASGYTAEFNFKVAELSDDPNAYVSALFSYSGKQDYWSARLSLQQRKLSIIHTKQGREQVLGSVTLPIDTDFTKLHTVRVESGSQSLRVYFDTMQKFNLPVEQSDAGRIGYESNVANVQYSYTAFSNDVDGSSDFEVYKPLPGDIEAIDFVKGRNRGYEVKDAEGETAYRQADGVAISKTDDNAYAVSLQKGDWLTYKVNASEEGDYGVYMTVKPDGQDASVQLTCGGTKETFTIAGKSGSDWQTVKLGKAMLSKGYHTLKITALKGGLTFQTFGLYKAVDVKPQNALQTINPDDLYGAFQRVGNGFQGSGSGDDRLFAGNPQWDDYEVSTDVGIPSSFDGEGQVLVRVTNDSYFPQQVQNSLMGYAVDITDGQIQLQRMNYDSTTVDSGLVDMNPGGSYPMTIRVNGSRIQVYWNGGKEPVIDYVDPHPFFHGRVGLRSIQSTVAFTNMQIKPVQPHSK